MILVDTNIWCDFFRQGDAELDELLFENRVVMHSLVIGELAMGHLPNRNQTLKDLEMLTRVKEASWKECFVHLAQRDLYGRGIQWNDLQLLTSALLTSGVLLWTRDRRLAAIADEVGVCFKW